MSELIYKELAVKVCDRALDLFGNQASIVYMVKDANQHLPTIAQERKSGKWIPVTERLPEKSVEVLTCDSVGDMEIRSLEASYDGMLYSENDVSEWECLSDAIAWMPLPEPWKEVMK